MRDDTVYLEHIAASAELIVRYLTGPAGPLDRESFFADMRTQDAVLRRLETLADAAGHLSVAVKANHPEIPWRQVSDFRNVLAHGYTDINLEHVWEIITLHLPALQAVVAEEFGGLPSDE